ncbi:MAG: hypothetical protein STHCBS139747_004880 [Sporothrix thermara]
MYTKSILLASLAASAATAKQLYPGHNQVRRDIAARQTDTFGDGDSTAVPADVACLTDLASVYDTLPTQPPALISFVMTASITDPCAFTLPASLSSELLSYESDVEDWYTSNSAAIASALSECPAYSSYASLSDGGDSLTGSYSDVCATATGGGSGGSDAKTTGTGASAKTTTGAGAGAAAATGAATGTDAAASSSTASTSNAGSKDSGMVGVAALAVVGVLGVVAAL